MKDTIRLLLAERLSGEFEWLIPELESLFQSQSGTVDQNIIHIGHNPKYGSAYAACIIDGPMSSPMDCSLPNFYEKILRRFNGAKLYAIDLFGWPEEQSNRRHCLSLLSANRFWINGYRQLPKGSFHLGSRTFSLNENIGYFYHPSLNLFAARKSGEVIGTWSSVATMVREEWNIAKEMEHQTQEYLYRA